MQVVFHSNVVGDYDCDSVITNNGLGCLGQAQPYSSSHSIWARKHSFNQFSISWIGWMDKKVEFPQGVTIYPLGISWRFTYVREEFLGMPSIFSDHQGCLQPLLTLETYSIINDFICPFAMFYYVLYHLIVCITFTESEVGILNAPKVALS